ncbi:hypothetical protein BR63_00790 [Thermanaerosceptrum fracticalcis]|uniref:Uncharacterized protein n=1 Tax=Thermanaerosceptrum fracticalcis TaxID=1712410 RepID=A0A7G6DYT3_THEFR|nr:hypothetical protein BR63_00790 [Thermanaerosceptrum fracticalcis]
MGEALAGRLKYYFGSWAPKYIAYGVASVSGVILAVCSCAILPLFAKIIILLPLIAGIVYISRKWFTKEQVADWMYETWSLAQKLFPVLLAGVFGALFYFST